MKGFDLCGYALLFAAAYFLASNEAAHAWLAFCAAVSFLFLHFEPQLPINGYILQFREWNAKMEFPPKALELLKESRAMLGRFLPAGAACLLLCFLLRREIEASPGLTTAGLVAAGMPLLACAARMFALSTLQKSVEKNLQKNIDK